MTNEQTNEPTFPAIYRHKATGITSHTIHSAQPKREPLTFGDVREGEVFRWGKATTLTLKCGKNRYVYLECPNIGVYTASADDLEIHTIYPNAILDLGEARRWK